MRAPGRLSHERVVLFRVIVVASVWITAAAFPQRIAAKRTQVVLGVLSFLLSNVGGSIRSESGDPHLKPIEFRTWTDSKEFDWRS